MVGLAVLPVCLRFEAGYHARVRVCERVCASVCERACERVYKMQGWYGMQVPLLIQVSWPGVGSR
jgi:hypothetical protein